MRYSRHPTAPDAPATVRGGRRRAGRGEGDQLRQEIIDTAEQLLIEAGDEHARNPPAYLVP